jgi:hypothetical protein
VLYSAHNLQEIVDVGSVPGARPFQYLTDTYVISIRYLNTVYFPALWGSPDGSVLLFNELLKR